MLTDQQITEAYKRNGSFRKAAKELGVEESVVRRRINKNHPDLSTVKASSTLYDKDGEQVLQWVKTSTSDSQRRVAMEAAAAELSKTIKPQPLVRPPKHANEALLNLYTLTDLHIGMHSWGKETGADWDLEIAEKVIAGAFAAMIAASPPARTCVVNQMGDALHTDSFKAMTPMSGHMLDADSRYQKIVEVAVRTLRFVINQALQKHERVLVNMLDANHDPVGETWLRVMFSALYENEPRVTVEMSPSPFTAIQHGETMLAFHHGHTVKVGNLPLLFAARYPEIWGSTKNRYCHTGHLHHIDEKEHPGMIVTQHPTLAAPDAYSARAGYDSQRSATAITYHKRFGQVGRQTVTPEMLED